jgi:hypothetical protein
MTLSNLYFRGCFEQPSEEQKTAIEEIGGTSSVVDKACSRTSINTCGMSIEQLFDTYDIYNPQKGLYKSWGDLEFPWEISSLTPNLIISDTTEKWGVMQYRAVVAYQQDSMVLLIEDDGYRVSLYKANQNILTTANAFDYSKWDKICHVETTEPAGLPSVEELSALYKPYKLELFDEKWSRYNQSWDTLLKDQSLQECIDQGLTIADLQNCANAKSSDEWDGAKIRKDFFYRAGDIVLVSGECEDVICAYICRQDIPALTETLATSSVFDPKDPLWQKVYCVSTDRNKCLEYERKKEPILGYDVVEIGSKGHFVEMPIPYRLKPITPDLTQRVEAPITPVTLSQQEIDALTPPT